MGNNSSTAENRNRPQTQKYRRLQSSLALTDSILPSASTGQPAKLADYCLLAIARAFAQVVHLKHNSGTVIRGVEWVELDQAQDSRQHAKPLLLQLPLQLHCTLFQVMKSLNRIDEYNIQHCIHEEMTSLDFSHYHPISDFMLSSAAKRMFELQALDISNAKHVTDMGIIELLKVDSVIYLKEINISATRTGDLAVLRILAHCPNLEKLSAASLNTTMGLFSEVIDGCHSADFRLPRPLNKKGFVPLCRRSLTYLDMSECPLLAAYTVKSLGQHSVRRQYCLGSFVSCFTNLETLILDDIPNLSHKSLSEFSLRYLHVFRAKNCTFLEENGVRIVLEACGPRLHILDIQNCPFLSDSSLLDVETFCSRRHVLPSVASNVAEDEREKCPNPLKVYIHGCDRFTERSITDFRARQGHLQTGSGLETEVEIALISEPNYRNFDDLY